MPTLLSESAYTAKTCHGEANDSKTIRTISQVD